MSEAVPPDKRVMLAQHRTTLASFRTSLALDRTTLAWIRTTLTMASFGLGLIGFFRSLRQAGETAETIRLHQSAIHFGTGLVVIGLVATVIAAWSHWSSLSKLRRGEALTVQRWPLSIVIALLLSLLLFEGLWNTLFR
jgi:uncharacterized membrane protein YidH (DUF202 family)